MSTRLLQWYFWYKITVPIIIRCSPSDRLRMFQKPGGLLSFFFLPPFFSPLQTDVPSSVTCPALLAFCSNRKACNVFWHKFYGQPAVVIGVNFYYGEKKKSQTKILKQTHLEVTPAQQLPNHASIWAGSDFPAAPSPYNRLECFLLLYHWRGHLYLQLTQRLISTPGGRQAQRVVGKYPGMVKKPQFPCAQDPWNSHLQRYPDNICPLQKQVMHTRMWRTQLSCRPAAPEPVNLKLGDFHPP